MKLRIIAIFFLLATTSTTVISQNKIVWVEHDYSTINIANLDKSEPKVILENFVHFPSTIYFDNETNRIFWGNLGSQTIASADYNLTEFTNHHRRLIGPRSIYIDNVNEWIYYGDASVARVERVRFDGSDEERLFSDNLGVAVYGLELDIPQNRMFFCTNDNIHVSDLDGSNETVIVSNVEPESMILDRNGERLYWAEPVFAGDGVIKSCNLDGSDIDTLPVSSKEPQSIEIDFDNQIIYWTDPKEEAIYTANLDGTNKSTLVDLSDLNFINRLVIELDLQNNVLYYASNQENGIYKVDLGTETDELFIADAIDTPIEVIIDDIEDRIYIADEERGVVSCNLNGSEVVELIDLQYVDGIAINEQYVFYINWLEEQIVRMDKDGQNQVSIVDDVCCISDIEIQDNILYWIDSNRDGIYSSNIDGSNVTSLIPNVSDARSMAVSMKDQKIYWTNRTINTPNNILYSADLDGTNITTITDTDGVQYIGWLTLDEVNDKIYYSQGTSNPSGIYKINKDGSEKELIFDTDYEPRGMALFFGITSTQESSNSILSIYPNPASQTITVKMNNGGDFNLKLYDLNGRLLIQQKNNKRVDVSSLNNGMYLLEIEDINLNQKTKEKILVINN